jgi:hypothetical protein
MAIRPDEQSRAHGRLAVGSDRANRNEARRYRDGWALVPTTRSAGDRFTGTFGDDRNKDACPASAHCFLHERADPFLVAWG